MGGARFSFWATGIIAFVAFCMAIAASFYAFGEPDNAITFVIIGIIGLFMWFVLSIMRIGAYRR